VRRRALLRYALGGMCTLPLGIAFAHTPYRQWAVYRQKHLLIGCHKGDLRTYDLAKSAIAVLEKSLPEAKARVARAPTTGRLASLLGTEQLDVAILANQDIPSMAAGRDAFKPYGEIALRALFPLSEFTLVGRASIPRRHAWLITSAMQGSVLSTGALQDVQPVVPWHEGAQDYVLGLPMPDELDDES